MVAGNLTFSYDAKFGAVCREPIASSTYVTTASITITSTSVDVLAAAVTVIEQLQVTLPSGHPDTTITLTNQQGSAFSTFIVPGHSISTAISHDQHHSERYPRPYCREGSFVFLHKGSGQQRKQACEHNKMKVADISIENFTPVANAMFRCVGPDQRAWIGSYNGDDYNGSCLSLYTGNSDSGGAVAVPLVCFEKLPIICQESMASYSFIHLKNEALDVCNESMKGIHIISELTSVKDASSVCESLGWNLLDLGNFNLLTFLSLCSKCNVPMGWIRSIHGYIDPDGLLYIAQQQNSLGVAIGISNDSSFQKVLAPVFCQDLIERTTSSSTYIGDSVIITSETHTPTVVIMETSVNVVTVTSTIVAVEVENVTLK